MTFEFDPYKSDSNKHKHGVDFVEIQALWNEVRVEVTSRVANEMRYSTFGLLNGKNYSVAISYRGSIIRIISARPSTENEIIFYEKHKKQ